MRRSRTHWRPARTGSRRSSTTPGNLMITIPPANGGASQTFPQPLEGSIIYPDTPGPWKVLLFLHGRHSTCIIGRRAARARRRSTSPDVTCRDTDNPDGTENTTNIRSYQGYDYLSTNLASHGYVVMSVSANTVVSFDNTFSYDAGANARSQIIAASLDLLYRWNNGTGPVVPGDDYHTVGEKLTGKMEMQRVGLMGHSRGGEGVTDYIRFNRQRPSGRIYNVQAVMSLAPIDSPEAGPVRHQLRRDPARVRRRRLDAGRRQRLRALQVPEHRRPTRSRRSSGTSRAPTTTTSTPSGRATTAPPTRAPAPARTSPAARTSRTRSGCSRPTSARSGSALMAGFLRNYLGMERAVRAADDRRGRLPAPSACPRCAASPAPTCSRPATSRRPRRART